jgi:serine acetyltransferase
MFRRLHGDVQAVFTGDAAAGAWLEILTACSGLHAIWFYSIGHANQK